MIDALYIATSGMNSQQHWIDVISNNVANINTPGFKRAQVEFSDMVYQDARLPEAELRQAPTSHMRGLGAEVIATHQVFSDGELKPTQNPLDLAVRGHGFFEAISETGETVYTRAGQLRVDRDGYLSTQNGHRLSANIQVPPDAGEMTIDEKGKVSARLTGSNETLELGQIELARFTNAEALKPLGDNQYAATDESGEAFLGNPGDTGLGTVLQGFTEVSNVELADEMTNLVLAQRAYQLNARVLQVSDQLLETVNNLRR